MTTQLQIEAPAAGVWEIDPTHSSVAFVVRHLMISNVRGRFTRFSGTAQVGETPETSSVEVEIDAASIDTSVADRDAHLRSADFFDVDQHATLEYRSTGVRPAGDGYIVDGELSLRGVTRAVPLHLEVNGFQGTTPFGDSRVGFSATAEIDRGDFGIEFNAPLEGGGVLLANKIQISLEIEAVLKDDGTDS